MVRVDDLLEMDSSALLQWLEREENKHKETGRTDEVVGKEGSGLCVADIYRRRNKKTR